MKRRRYLTANDAADAFGMERREFRERLHELHEEHGGVIFRKSDARNAKLWTTREVLRKHFPEAFGEITQLDIIELLELLHESRKRIARLEKKVNTK